MKNLFFIFLLLLSAHAYAVEPSEMLPDPALEARAREISQNLRCLVCQGQDIDDSQADLAGDLRRLVRARITAGDTDAQVYGFIKARYGDYVLMNPPLEGRTALLWAAPLLALCAGLGIAFLFIRKNGGS